MNKLLAIILAASALAVAALPAGAADPSLPKCASHSATAWHGLCNSASGSCNDQATCHYDHEHKHAPSEHGVDSIFGPITATLPTSLSYPWQTPSENAAKHAGYQWQVRGPDVTIRGGQTHWVRAVRAEGHATGHTTFNRAPGDPLARFHSFFAQAQLCRRNTDSTDTCGTWQSGGWQDFGSLMVSIDGAAHAYVPLCTDPSQVAGMAPKRLHAYRSDGQAPGQWTWYGQAQPAGQTGTVALASVAWASTDSPVNLDPAYPYAGNLHCPDMDCPQNNSRMGLHFAVFEVREKVYVPTAGWVYTDPDRDGLANLDIWVSRYGKPVDPATCAGGVSLDCIPFKLINVPLPVGAFSQSYQYRDDTHHTPFIGDTGERDFDTSPPGQWWITRVK